MGHNGVIKGMLTHVVAHHKNTVTAIAMCPSPGSGKGESTSVYVVTGSKDTTVMLWEVDVASKSPPEKPIHILFGHDDAVSAVAIDADLDMVASVSLDGTCIVHTLKSGVYTLTIRATATPLQHQRAAAREHRCRLADPHDVCHR